MKARRFIKRDRETFGRATGGLSCRLLLPATDEEYSWFTSTTNPERAVGKIRKFILRHLSKSSELLIDASFIIQAGIRISKSRLGHKQLAVWKYGDELTPVFEKAIKEYGLLEFEEDWEVIEVDI